MPDRRFLTLKEVCSLTGLQKSTIYALIKASRFIAPVKISSSASRWPSDQVFQWMDDRIAERDAALSK